MSDTTYMNFLIKPFLNGSSGISVLGSKGLGGGIKAARRLILLFVSSELSFVSTLTVLFLRTLGFLDCYYCYI
jgi:hypothetical protein